MAKCLLDSSTYIDIERAYKHRNEPWAVATLRQTITYRATSGRLIFSVVTVAEILKGLLRNVDSAKAATFRREVEVDFEVLVFDAPIAYLASEIMAKLENRRQTIGFADSVIAATAIQHSLQLVTSNPRHFQRVVDLGYPMSLADWRNP